MTCGPVSRLKEFAPVLSLLISSAAVVVSAWSAASSSRAVTIAAAQAEVSTKQLGIASEQFAIASKQFELSNYPLDQRPYLVMEYPLQTTGPIRLRPDSTSETNRMIAAPTAQVAFRIRNYGKTPAVITNTVCHMALRNPMAPGVEPSVSDPANRAFQETSVSPVLVSDENGRTGQEAPGSMSVLSAGAESALKVLRFTFADLNGVLAEGLGGTFDCRISYRDVIVRREHAAHFMLSPAGATAEARACQDCDIVEILPTYAYTAPPSK